MGIEIASAFERKSTVPIDETAYVADLTARDAIDAGIRFEGFIVFVTAEGKNYQLIGGITNSEWVEFGAGGGGGTIIVGSTITGTGTISATDEIRMAFNINAGANTDVTLPACSADTIGREVMLKRIDSGVDVNGYTVQVLPYAGDSIDEGAQTIPYQNGKLRFIQMTATSWGVF